MKSFDQITVRGLDPQTKQRLKEQAAQKGVSVNHLAVEALRHTAGTDNIDQRYQRMRRFLLKHSIPKADSGALIEAVDWMDKASKAKENDLIK